jgi:anthranilate phosphoribosyltransferase
VLEEVGLDMDTAPEAVEATIEEAGIGYMHAPAFHPAMKAVIGPRREVGMRTIFNVLGPLTNPAGADAQVMGVYDPGLVGLIGRAVAEMPVDHALIVHGSGMDEITVHDETAVAEVEGSEVTEYTITPDEIGLATHDIEAVAGGTPAENAEDLLGIVEGDVRGAKRDIILANAGAAVYVAGMADSLEAGVEAAADGIDSGDAAAKLDDLREVSTRVAADGGR